MDTEDEMQRIGCTCKGYFKCTDSSKKTLLFISVRGRVGKDDAKLFSRYMDDIIRLISKSNIETKLQEINNLHTFLVFTIVTEKDGQLLFLDMKVTRSNCRLSSTWYCKSADT